MSASFLNSLPAWIIVYEAHARDFLKEFVSEHASKPLGCPGLLAWRQFAADKLVVVVNPSAKNT